MLEFGANDAGSGEGPGTYVKDGTEATFMADVVEASREQPVIVDFWAPWCGPCKTLGPALEAAVEKARGKVRMVKIDVDQNPRLVQMLAQQGLPMQSIPTVVGFVGGQIADMFQGAVPPGQIDAFIDALVRTGGSGGLEEALEAAEEMLDGGAAADAAQTFAAIAAEDPASARAHAGLIRAHLAMGEADRAQALLDALPGDVANAPEVEAARAQLALAGQAAAAGPVAELLARVEADPDDRQARFDLATALEASGDRAGAVDQLLELFRRDREWNDGAAKAQLLTIFEAAGPKDPVALAGRRRLGSMILI
ncbi:putative thioredoxin [Hasllibacter halocynthiae]|uniref:Putative thioredoxin n=1 Tax=Hasllibacter halocynthiae TaxID=595589 RepID=A0A2T0X1E1_9RHOB|nr:tetratricopeptide repeat protein [Hasllibacter halocynthiae]PRY92773.1 putative thioredoxin [Hasllibacter halocynthiae]